LATLQATIVHCSGKRRRLYFGIGLENRQNTCGASPGRQSRLADVCSRRQGLVGPGELRAKGQNLELSPAWVRICRAAPPRRRRQRRRTRSYQGVGQYYCSMVWLSRVWLNRSAGQAQDAGRWKWRMDLRRREGQLIETLRSLSPFWAGGPVHLPSADGQGISPQGADCISVPAFSALSLAL
jgi:hypothetical protein